MNIKEHTRFPISCVCALLLYRYGYNSSAAAAALYSFNLFIYKCILDGFLKSTSYLCI
jgi:hypothetical protein